MELSITIERKDNGKKAAAKREKPLWQRAQSSVKFQENGLWGLKSPDGE